MKLTKADIDKVRHIEGFPIGTDEDIIALSRPPYYTACPNPFIADFIAEHGTPYDEATDEYHREPFAADVSEGKNDPIYNAHSYHTKVPYKAIMRYILHYTKPGDIVFDGFCGTGMTGVAAQMCGCPDPAFKAQLEQEMKDDHIEWGARRAVLNDLSPAATFIAYNYNTPVDVAEFEREAKRILAECEKECGWMYNAPHFDVQGNPVYGIDGLQVIGRESCTVWSDILVCPSCSREIDFYDAAFDAESGKVADEFDCPHCGSILKKRDCSKAMETSFDEVIGEQITQIKQKPKLVSYYIGRKKYTRGFCALDQERQTRIDTTPIEYFVPTDKWIDGEKPKEPIRLGLARIYQMYSKRNLVILSNMLNKIEKSHMVSRLKILFTSQLINISKLNRFRPTVSFPYNPLSGTLYIASMYCDSNPFIAYENKLNRMIEAFNLIKGNDACISCSSLSGIYGVPECSIDYIFTDPPFGANLNYSELSNMWEAWLRIKTNNQSEAIINTAQKKSLVEYQQLMEQCFTVCYHALKYGRWMTVEFHNSKNAVWNAIQEALYRSGFIVADVRIINKQQGSFNQVTAQGAVQQDLVISAYKPKESFVREFQQRAGDPEMAWEFVRQHIANVPVAPDGNRDGKIDMVAERCDYLLFDRMVAYHIMNGIPVPMDAHTFYDGLRQRFLMRDGMFFLPDQVNEYDEKRTHMELDTMQLSFIVSDEKNAIQWLNYILSDHPQTYQEIQPQYLQELHQQKNEVIPELLDMLRDSFLQDDEGRWYVPDLSSAADLAKLRLKKLVKEFYDTYVPGKGKLKVFRMEAIRAGFDECWSKRDYKTIVHVGERLPETVLQEDPALLMYYDNACSRV